MNTVLETEYKTNNKLHRQSHCSYVMYSVYFTLSVREQEAPHCRLSPTIIHMNTNMPVTQTDGVLVTVG